MSRWVGILKWLVVFSLLSGVAAVAYMVRGAFQSERAAEEAGERIQSPKRAKGAVVELGPEIVERYGLADEPAQATEWSERVPVYGRVVSNPRATIELRAPFAGTVRAATDSPWPVPGQWVQASRVLGWLDIRVGPQERLDLRSKLDEALLKQQGAEEVVKLREERADRLKTIASGAVPRRELDDALVQLAEAKTQLSTARAAVELWQKALEEVDRRRDNADSAWSHTLTAPADGEVTELSVRPGMAVEPGALLAQFVDFRRPLVRLDIPPEVLGNGPPRRVQLLAVRASPPALRGASNRPESTRPTPAFGGVLVGPAPELDVASQFVGYWYELETVSAAVRSNGDSESNGVSRVGATTPASGRREPADSSPRTAQWRPGLQVKAELEVAGADPQPAVSVPATAVLFHQGRALVYVRIGPGKYQRREVRVLGSDGDHWVLARRKDFDLTGVSPDEAVVSRQAQVLLSEEFRSDTTSN